MAVHYPQDAEEDVACAGVRRRQLPGMTCTICGNRRDNRTHVAREMMFGLRDRFRYLECGACGCLRLLDPPGDVARYYPETYYAFAVDSALQEALKRRWSAHAHGRRSVLGWAMSQLLGPYQAMLAVRRARIPFDARVLDVGCGAGRLIRDMKQLGYRSVCGLDPYIEHDIHYDDGVTVLRTELSGMTGEFDVIMLHHSFEHMPEPETVLSEVKRLLWPAGRILLRVPVADSFAWRRYGVNWMHLDPPRHVFLHTRKSIEMLADRCGLNVSSVVFEGNATQFIGSEQYEKDIPLADRRSVYSGGVRRWIGWWRARGLQRRVDELNRNGQGDWACFELTVLREQQPAGRGGANDSAR
jgi:SAM-dependent methyltransferase